MQERTPAGIPRQGDWVRVGFHFTIMFWVFFLSISVLFQIIYAQDSTRVEGYVSLFIAITAGLLGFTVSPYLSARIPPVKILLPCFAVVTLGLLLASLGTSRVIIAPLLLAPSGILLPLLIRRGILLDNQPLNLLSSLSFQFLLLAPLLAIVSQFLLILLQVGPILTFGHLIITLCLISAIPGLEHHLGNQAGQNGGEALESSHSPKVRVQKTGITQAIRYWKKGLLPCSFLLVLFLTLFLYAFPIYVFPYLVVLPDIVHSTLIIALFSIGVFLMPFLGALLAHSKGLVFDPATHAFRFKRFFLVTSTLDLAALGCFVVKDTLFLAEGILIPVGTLLLFFGLGIFLQAFFILVQVKQWPLEIAVTFPLAGMLGGCFLLILVIYSIFFLTFFYLFIGGYILFGAFFVYLCKRAAPRPSEASA